jgi:hypothetical protein
MSSDSPPPNPDPDESRTVTVIPSSPQGTGTFFAPSGDSTATNSGNTPLPPAPPGYELLGEIGRGGMGVVYKARQKGLNRLVALKVILAGGHASASQRSRFLHEAEAVAAINHTGIVGVYESGTWEGQPYMALEFCTGGTLAEKLAGTPLSTRDATVLVEQVARAVAIAHEKGIVHRDIKPANVLIDGNGIPKVGDFGVAKLTETQEGLTATGAIMGTPSYMAPEQARGEAKKVGPAADVYALGAVLYECLTGRPPFKGASPAETILQTLNQEPVSLRALNPLVPVDLETVCMKCLDKDAVRRYPTAQALAEDLHRFLQGLPVIARPVGLLGRSRRWIRRNQVVTGLLAVIVLAVLSGTTATYIKYRDEAKQRDVAEQEAGAKERALGELRKTLAAVEELTEKQKQTLIRLTEEKAASEDAFLRGLLRPLREHTNFQATLEETKVLFELAALPEERLRFRFIHRGLDSQHGVASLAAWPQEVTNAVVGLDRAAAVRLREVIGKILKDEKCSPNVRTACVLLAGALPPEDKEFNSLAARNLIDRMVEEKDELVLSQLSDGLSTLSPRFSPEESSLLAKSLLERLINQQPLVYQQHLNVVLTLASQLPPADAATIARTLVGQVNPEKEASAFALFLSPLPALALRLNSVEAEKIVTPVARILLGRTIAETNPTARFYLSNALTPLIPFLDPSENAKFAKNLLGRIVKERDIAVLNQLNPIFENLVGKLSSQDSGSLSRELIEGILATKDPNIVGLIGSGLPIMGSQMDANELPRVSSLVARLVEERISGEKDLNSLASLNLLLMRVSEWLRLEDLAKLEKAIVERMTSEKNTALMTPLANCIQNLCTRLRPTDAKPLAEMLVKRMVNEKDPAVLDPFANASSALLRRVGHSGATELAGPLVRSLAARVAAEADSDAMNTLALNVSILGSVLSPPEVRATARVLLGRILVEKDQAFLTPLAAAFNVIGARVPPIEATTLARDLTKRIIDEKDYASLIALGSALSGLGNRLSQEELEPVIRTLATRLGSDKDPNSAASVCTTLSGLSKVFQQEDAVLIARTINARLLTEKDGGVIGGCSMLLSAVAERLNPSNATLVARNLMGRLTQEKDQSNIGVLATAMTSVASRLSPEDARPIAQALGARMISEKDPASVTLLVAPISNLIARLSDVDLYALMKSNLVFSPILTPALNEFGRRSTRTQNVAAGAIAGALAAYGSPSPAFKDTWEFLDWAERTHPEFNFSR